jgi:hypothetical protein
VYLSQQLVHARIGDQCEHAVQEDQDTFHREAHLRAVHRRGVGEGAVIDDVGEAVIAPLDPVVRAAVQQVVSVRDRLHRLEQVGAIRQVRQHEAGRPRQQRARRQAAGLVVHGDRKAFENPEVICQADRRSVRVVQQVRRQIDAAQDVCE